MCIRDSRIPILQSEGFEADDVIGTLARQAAEEGHDVFVVSNDKDMLQLVTGQIKVLNPVKDNLILDREKVVEVLGVAPEQVIDVMALRGDSIDNIPVSYTHLDVYKRQLMRSRQRKETRR